MVTRPGPPKPPRGTRAAETPPGAIREFVLQADRLRRADLSFRSDPELPPLPLCASGGGLSHYLLLAASIDAGVNSNDIRPFLCALDNALRDSEKSGGLFDITLADAGAVDAVIEREERNRRLLGWQAKRHVPRILSEANAFVRERAGGDFDAWARGLAQPEKIVEQLARGIFYQGRASGEARKKMWMLMRWLVRPAPDLRLWDHLSPSDLMVPVDRHVARFAVEAGIIAVIPEIGPTALEVRVITDFARKLFPDDPALVDYAFFMWGRGKSRPVGDPDTCHTLFAANGLACPLEGLMSCSNYCAAVTR